MAEPAKGPLSPLTTRLPPLMPRPAHLPQSPSTKISPLFKPCPTLSKRNEPPSNWIVLNAAAGADFENIARCHFFASSLQLDFGDLLGGFAFQQMRDERRKIEPLAGLLLEGEDKRLHGNRSFK